MSETHSWIRSLRTELPSWILLAAVGLASVAVAGGDSHAEAKVVFQDAQAQFDSGHYQRALEGYRRAYALAPLPELLYDAAQCERKLERWSDAERDYRRFLEASPQSPQRPLVLTLIGEMHANAGRTHVERRSTSPQPGAVEVSRPADPATGPAESVDSTPAPAPAPAETVPAAPSDAPLALSLAPSPSPAIPPKATSGRQEAAPATPLYKKWWFWGGIAVVAAGTVTAIAVSSHGGSPANTSLGKVDLR